MEPDHTFEVLLVWTIILLYQTLITTNFQKKDPPHYLAE